MFTSQMYFILLTFADREKFPLSVKKFKKSGKNRKTENISSEKNVCILPIFPEYDIINPYKQKQNQKEYHNGSLQGRVY